MKLKSIPDISKWDTSNVIYMGGCFKGISSLITLSNRKIKDYEAKYGEYIRNLTSRDKECFCLVMGNEGRGVSKEILDICDKFIYIEMDSHVESLNVGVATSILLYELNRK